MMLNRARFSSARPVSRALLNILVATAVIFGTYWAVHAFRSPWLVSPVLVFGAGFLLNAAVVLQSFSRPSGAGASRTLRNLGAIGMIVAELARSVAFRRWPV